MNVESPEILVHLPPTIRLDPEIGPQIEKAVINTLLTYNERPVGQVKWARWDTSKDSLIVIANLTDPELVSILKNSPDALKGTITLMVAGVQIQNENDRERTDS